MTTLDSASIKGKLEKLEDTLSRNAEAVFWCAFIAVPLLTGLLAYDWLPHEAYNPATDRLIASHEISDDDDRTGTVYDVWQDKKTGAIYTLRDFEEHRDHEALRMAYTWFMYGLIGCAFFAYRQHKLSGKKFTTAFAQALMVDVAIALFTYFGEQATNHRILQ